jgi:hypothetical protein
MSKSKRRETLTDLDFMCRACEMDFIDLDQLRKHIVVNHFGRRLLKKHSMIPYP